jgi:hypothetical protein
MVSAQSETDHAAIEDARRAMEVGLDRGRHQGRGATAPRLASHAGRGSGPREERQSERETAVCATKQQRSGEIPSRTAASGSV